jgi:hypothetical protein
LVTVRSQAGGMPRDGAPSGPEGAAFTCLYVTTASLTNV